MLWGLKMALNKVSIAPSCGVELSLCLRCCASATQGKRTKHSVIAFINENLFANDELAAEFSKTIGGNAPAAPCMPGRESAVCLRSCVDTNTWLCVPLLYTS